LPSQIMLRFPDGKRLQRRFDGDTATAEDVYRWAEAEGVTAAQFRCAALAWGRLPTTLLTRPLYGRLVAAYPRTVYTRGGDKLHTLGLGSQAALLIEATTDE
jgi:hypothetical protein